MRLLSKVLGILPLVLIIGCEAPQTRSTSAPAAAYRIYVTNEFSGDISVIDSVDRTVKATVPLGKRPRGIVASRDGKTLYIALTGSAVAPPGIDENTLPPPDKAADGVATFDTTSLKSGATIRGVPDPEQLAVGADGQIYAGSQAGNSVIANVGAQQVSIPIGTEPEGVYVTPNNKTLLVTLEDDNALVLVDVASRKIVGRVAVGKRPRSVTVDARGGRAYVTNEFSATVSIVELSQPRVSITIKLPGKAPKPMGVVVSPDGENVYVTTGRDGNLVKFDASSGAVRGIAAVGGRPWGVALSPDGKLAYTANGPANDVAIIDTAKMIVVGRVKVGERPWGVVVAR